MRRPSRDISSRRKSIDAWLKVALSAPDCSTPILGLDTDNDTVFINETVKAWCETSGVEFTRSRPYCKNDQAHIEQKNGAVVRRMVGFRRFEGLAAVEALARLYRPLRLFVSFFQPSFRLAEKKREGALIRKRYHAPLTPHQRLVADPRAPQALKDALDAQHRLSP